MATLTVILRLWVTALTDKICVFLVVTRSLKLILYINAYIVFSGFQI